MSDLSVELRITSIRSRGRPGGAIFSGSTEEGQHFVAVCDYKLIPNASLVEKGQIWLVRGTFSRRQNIAKNGYLVEETQIFASEASLLRPVGRNIVGWIASCPDCEGIGRVKAQKLWDRFGLTLAELIDRHDIDALGEILAEKSAQVLCNAFQNFMLADTLLWLDRIGLPRKIGASVAEYYRDEAQVKVEANPYVLISFESGWAVVDEIARTRFGMALDDPRRLEAAIEEVLYRGLANGHMCMPEGKVNAGLTTLLKSSDFASKALAAVEVSHQFKHINGYYQSAGAYIIESYVAQGFYRLVAGIDEAGQSGLFSQICGDPDVVHEVIAKYERSQCIMLSQEQRDAVLTSVVSHLSLILGGAGTGKTTVLKALYQALRQLNRDVTIYQMALAGRAAQRMTEATGVKSMTIAGFLSKVDANEIEMGSVIVVDEMSMVDIILIYRLLRYIPEGVKLILVGDPCQIMPIGPGLVLHALAGHPAIPQTELKVVQRQSAESGIPRVAAAIRAHQKPVWAEYHGRPDVGVSFIPCAPVELESTVQRVYEELGGTGNDYTVQILSITNANLGGVRNLNFNLHSRYRQTSESVRCYDPEFGLVNAMTLDKFPLKVGDLVMFTENDYELDLRNGSLGKIIEAFPVEEPDDPCCVCDFEGTEFLLDSLQLNALKHSYSITIHKSQGSQFRRVIVPIRQSRLLDQSLIYTAVTRGIEQVVLVGDENSALAAIQAISSADRRHITLPLLLTEFQP